MSAESAPQEPPRPPEGDWLGTPYLRFEREGSLARCVVDRPEARNAMTMAMYFGVRRAIDVVARDADLDVASDDRDARDGRRRQRLERVERQRDQHGGSGRRSDAQDRQGLA